MIGDTKDKKNMDKKRPKPSPFVSKPSAPTVAPSNEILAHLSDVCEMEINQRKISVNVRDMQAICNLGEGQFGVVDKMKHIPSETIFAVKKIRCSMDEKEQSRMLNDFNISMRSSQCTYIIASYGAMCHCGDVWICMEVFDTSLDKFYKKMPEGEFVAENLLAYITFCMVSALEYLHRYLKVMHRDVKPSNVLLDREGRVKICDFGISGYLIKSMAKTQVGCQPYLSPERIDPDRTSQEYGIKSDVWSLGLSVLEVAIRRFPYGRWFTLMEQLTDIVYNDTTPSLPLDAPYSKRARKFISRCLVKSVVDRAKYDELLKDKWLKGLDNEHNLGPSRSRLAVYVAEVLDAGQ